MADGRQERWADTVIRVVEGVMSIRKNWMVQHRLRWNEEEMQLMAAHMVDAIFTMKFLPSGRNLWVTGSDYMYERGGLAANNCQYVHIRDLAKDSGIIMNSLLKGVGVGFGADENFKPPVSGVAVRAFYPHVIEDTGEAWAESVERLIEAHLSGTPIPQFDYSKIRLKGEPIRGFGGTASGPEPLILLHKQLTDYLDQYKKGKIDATRLLADIVNSIGSCVVAGNVRRSAELYLGSPTDETFLDLKNYKKNPEREAIGWMSNNSIRITEHDHFIKIPELAERIITNGEPGFVNMLNIKKYGRYGEIKEDTAEGTNPCSEATLESYELCCLVEIFPSLCKTEEEFYRITRLATFFASTVSLLLTEVEEINAVVTRNHRIGVSMSGVADLFDKVPATQVIRMARKGYRIIEEENLRLAREAGVPESIRKTVVKPSGTVSLLAGASPGMHYPPFRQYVRRMRVANDSPLVPLLDSAGVPNEPDQFSANTLVFEFPVRSEAKRSQRDLTIWQKGAMLTMLQQHWADQMVSNTLTFDPETEGKQLADFIAMTLPQVKSMSLLADKGKDGVGYAQAPYEAIDDDEFERRTAAIGEVDWSKFEGSDGEDSKFCESDTCEI